MLMTTKRTFRGKFKVVLREDDHLPPHVHVVGGGIDVSVDLETLKSCGKWPRAIAKEAMEFITSHLEELKEEWKKWHP